MFADDPSSAIARKINAIKEELEHLNLKIEKLIENNGEENLITNHTGGFILNYKGQVVWWSKVKEAARYCLILLIDSEEVCSIDFDRETRYYVFEKLPKNISCSIKVLAEDRDGREIVSATIEL